MSISTPTSADAALARELVAGLIEACRDGEHVFELASRQVHKPVLRAELMQYSVQRREFVVELEEAVHMIGEDSHDHPAQAGHRWNALEHASDPLTILDQCERQELSTLDAYRQALSAGLPFALASLIHSQFLAITRVQARLQSLADLARGGSPIDSDS